MSLTQVGRDFTFRSHVPSLHRKMRTCFVATSPDVSRLPLRRPSRFSNSRQISRRFVITKVRRVDDITPEHIMFESGGSQGKKTSILAMGK